MNVPAKRNGVIDADRIRGWLSRFDGYRVSVTEPRIHGWLDQFEAADRDIGARVLDAVLFVRAQDVESSLRAVVEALPGWHPREDRRSGKWRFVAFSVSAGESGDSMLGRCRTALSLSGRQHNALFIHMSDLLREPLGDGDSVVFVDDFAGSGEQACDAWRERLEELLPGGPKSYLVLVAAGAEAVRRIASETRLKVVPGQVLGPEDNLYAKECKHFTSGEKKRVLHYCTMADRARPRGYADCGFVVVLADKTPNNSIPILHANHSKWGGLFPRYG